MAKKIFFTFSLLAIFIISTVVQAADRPGNPEFYRTDLYAVKQLDNGNKIIVSAGKTVATLNNFYYYNQNGKRKLKLVSRTGFTLKNIPTNTTYFFNECIAIFLEGEELLPKAKKWLKNHHYQSKSLRGLVFEFPDKPVISKNGGYTTFLYQTWVAISRRRGHWEDEWLLGLTDQIGAAHAIVTYSYGRDSCNLIHEYIHMCGYGEKYHDKPVFKGSLRSTYHKLNPAK